jgi:hypothetical protein
MKPRVFSAVLSAIALGVSSAALADQDIDCATETAAGTETTCDITMTPVVDGPLFRIAADAGGIGIGDGTGGLPFVLVTNAPAGSLIVDANGNVTNGNVGANTTAAFRIRRVNGSAKLLVQEGSGTVDSRELLELRNNGPIGFAMTDTNTGQTWRFAAQTTGFRINLVDGVGPDFEVLNNGDAVARGTFIENSDVNLKSDIETLDGNLVLAKLESLPVSEWSYKKDGPSVRHIGPMAQDFHATFGLGDDETKVSPRDMAGVSLAAIKALSAELKEKDAEIASQREQIAALQARLNELDQLKAQITAIESRLPHQMATRN